MIPDRQTLKVKSIYNGDKDIDIAVSQTTSVNLPKVRIEIDTYPTSVALYLSPDQAVRLGAMLSVTALKAESDSESDTTLDSALGQGRN